MSNVQLKLSIEEARRAISSLQTQIDAHVKWFQQNGVDYSSRIGPRQANQWQRYDLMIFQERQLELVQQKLASFLLEQTPA